MTLGGWIGYIAIVLVIFGIYGLVRFCSDGYYDTERENKIKKAGLIVSIVVSILALVLMLFLYNGTESGKRALKSWESETNAGIERRVTVYDVEGELIAEYEGKFDVDYDDDRIIFDDQNGKRHIIYYPTGTVIIDEL